MLNFRICGIAAGAALIFSLLLGLASGTPFPALALRALAFGILFFMLFCLIFWLVNRFIPELLSVSGSSLSGLNISPGQGGASAASSGSAAGAFPSSGSAAADDEVDDIESKVFESLTRGSAQQDFSPNKDGVSDPSASGGLDQKEEEDYTEKRTSAAQPAGDDLMPDFDALSEAFSMNSGSGEEEPDGGIEAVPVDRRPKSGSKKSDALKGDFNPKELAQAIQTVLKKDEKKQ
jgi:hypothetical protein